MKRNLILSAISFCIFVAHILVVDQAFATISQAWVQCDIVRVGTMNEYAFLQLTSTGPQAGVFTNMYFQIDENIRKEGLAVAMTALSLDKPLVVLVTTDTNGGYQILKAIFSCP